MKKHIFLFAAVLGVILAAWQISMAQTSTTTESETTDTTTTTTAPPPSTPTIPESPSGLLADEVTISAVNLIWTDNSSNENKFNIERKLSTASSYSFLQQVGTSITNFTDSTVVPGSTYSYRVQACLSGTGCSGYTTLSVVAVPSAAQTSAPNTDPATTTSGTGTIGTVSGGGTTYAVPAAPSGLMINGTVGSNSVPLRWTDNAIDEDKFNIERKLSTASTFAYLVQITGSNITSYIDSTVSLGNTYDYRIQACRSGYGCSAFSNYVRAIVPTTATYSPATTTTYYPSTTTVTTTYATSSGPNNSPYATYTPTTYTPPAPTNLRVAFGPCGPNLVNLSWQAGTGATSYRISRGSLIIGNTTQLTYNDQSAALSKNYVYMVNAVNSYGISPGIALSVNTPTVCTTYPYATPTTAPTTTAATGNTSTTSTSTTGIFNSPYSVPRPPSNLVVAAAPTVSTVVLRWIDNANNEDKFNVYRKVSGASTFVYLYQIVGANNTSYIDASVSSGMKYDYAVQACLSGTGCSNFVYLYGVTVPIRYSATTTPVYKAETSSSTNFASTTVQIKPTITPYNASTALPYTYTASSTYTRPTTTTESRPISTSTFVVTSTTTTTVASTSREVAQMEDIVLVIENTNALIENIKRELVNIIDESISNAMKGIDTSSGSTTNALSMLREDLKKKIDIKLAGLTTITDSEINSLKFEITNGLKQIQVITNSSQIVSLTARQVEIKLDGFSNQIEDQSKALMEQGGDLLFKDSNNDGISDYESKAVYNIDPIKPSPVTVYEGKTLTAGDKVAMGFDPSERELVKIVPEQPAEAFAPVTLVHKVEEIKLNEEKKVELKGKALPNSYVTIFIYSTPIIVTVKVDQDGEWQYVLDKELESGEHVVYTATVNNTGKILAKSNPYSFTKTAEAASLNSIPPVSTLENEPSLFDQFSTTAIITLAGVLFLAVLFLAGRKRDDTQIGTGNGAGTV